MSIKQAAIKGLDACLCFVRRAWRPITQLGIAGTLIANGVVIPLYKWEVPDMTAMAAYVAAATAAFSVRAWEKHKSAADESPG